MQINSTSPYASLQPAPAATRVPKQTMGQEDFLRLITVQLAHQDPMKPMEDTAFIAQMAEFTSLEQTSQLARDFAAMRTSTDLTAAGSLLGRQVTVQDANGERITGTVSAIDSTGKSPRLLIDGVLYPYSAVKIVELAPPPQPDTAA
jgi:flagellar basal-body rod modification protein FlgD